MTCAAPLPCAGQPQAGIAPCDLRTSRRSCAGRPRSGRQAGRMQGRYRAFLDEPEQGHGDRHRGELDLPRPGAVAGQVRRATDSGLIGSRRLPGQPAYGVGRQQVLGRQVCSIGQRGDRRPGGGQPPGGHRVALLPAVRRAAGRRRAGRRSRAARRSGSAVARPDGRAAIRAYRRAPRPVKPGSAVSSPAWSGSARAASTMAASGRTLVGECPAAGRSGRVPARARGRRPGRGGCGPGGCPRCAATGRRAAAAAWRPARRRTPAAPTRSCPARSSCRRERVAQLDQDLDVERRVPQPVLPAAAGWTSRPPSGSSPAAARAPPPPACPGRPAGSRAAARPARCRTARRGR